MMELSDIQNVSSWPVQYYLEFASVAMHADLRGETPYLAATSGTEIDNAPNAAERSIQGALHGA